MRKLFVTLFFLSILHQVNADASAWRGELKLNDSIRLPFHFEWTATHFSIINQTDTLKTKEIITEGDSVTVKLAVFGSELHFKNDPTELKGYFVNTTKAIPVYIPFRADKFMYRFFDRPEKASVDFTGRYDIYFKNEEPESIHCIGLFKQTGNYITGTFLTPTGDYRFLEGDVSGDHAFLSAFDGSHVYYFSARMKGDSIVDGKFYAAISWFDEWTGVKNPNAKLADADSLVQFNEYPLRFAFRNTEGIMVAINDSLYRGKPLIVQLMGSWCPNCMDETRFLSSWYNQRKNKNVEVIALDFERIIDTAKINTAIHRIQSAFDVRYPILYAGTSDKKIAVKQFPQLDRIYAFPTLLLLDAEKKIVRAHSGFSGPATGEEYEKFIRWFESSLEKINR